MAIDSITISQDNKINGSDLLPVHSPLVFLIDVEYTGAYPLVVLVDVIDENDEVLDSFRATIQRDLLANLRQFSFVANDVIKGLMDDFGDVQQLNDTLVYINGITKRLTLKFTDPDNELMYAETTVTFVHGAAQFGDNPNFDEIYNDSNSTYYGPGGAFVYTYFYNEDPANVLTIDSPVGNYQLALDYDDIIFSDYDDEEFEIFTNI